MAIKDDLVSVWELNEASGNALDSHGSNTLTDTNTVGAGTGVVAGCRTFAVGSSERFQMGSNASVLMGDIDMTMAAWVRLNSKTAVRSIASKWTTTGSQREYWMLYNSGTDRFRFSVSGNGSTQTNASADTLGSPSTGVWYWVVGGHSAGSNVAWICINNGTVDTIAFSAGLFTGSSDFFIGGIGGTSLFYDGDIDQVALWKRDLRSTPTDMTALYNGGSGLAYSSWDAVARRRQLLHAF